MAEIPESAKKVVPVLFYVEITSEKKFQELRISHSRNISIWSPPVQKKSKFSDFSGFSRFPPWRGGGSPAAPSRRIERRWTKMALDRDISRMRDT